jgi:peptide chain release factor 2
MGTEAVTLSRNECEKLIDRWTKIENNYPWEETNLEIKELETRLFDPELWNNPENASEINKEFNNLSKRFNNMKEAQEWAFFIKYTLENQDPLNSIISEFNRLTEFCNNYELGKQFSEESDKLPALLKITAGAGGTEAQDWASMIFRMYIQWAKTRGYEVTIENLRGAEPVGINTATIKISGPDYPYGLLKGETGIHRLVRVSPFNAQGKRMTSFCAVYVTPLVDDTFEVNVPESDITFEYFRSSGAGGQNVNKVESGVRARYWWTNSETGEKEEILVENTETRDQPKNKENAVRILKSRVYQKELDIKLRKEKEIEDAKADNGWGNQKRSYVLDDCRVKDHITNYQESNPEHVLDGNIDNFLKANLYGN